MINYVTCRKITTKLFYFFSLVIIEKEAKIQILITLRYKINLKIFRKNYFLK